MNPIRRQLLLVAMLILALSAVVGWSYSVLADSRAAAWNASERVTRCDALVRSIEALRDQPKVAGSRELKVDELTRYIEQAAHAMQIESIARITPESPQRLGDTAYLEKPSQLLLRGVTLEQITGFLHHLSTDGSGLSVRNLRLSAPRDEAASDRWTVEATITYILYAPTQPNRTTERR